MDKKRMLKYLDELVEIGADEYYDKHRKSLTLSGATTIADTAFSLYVREKEPMCSCCGKMEPEIKATCGHLFSRSWIHLRWDETNAAMQCMGCNMVHEHNPEIFRRVMVIRHGESAINQMWDRRNGDKIVTYDRLVIAEKYYKKYLALKGGK